MKKKISKEQIEDIVKEVISSQKGVKKESLSDDMDLQTDVNLDSLDIVEIIMDLEDKFNIQFKEDETFRFNTISQIIDYVERKIK